MVSITFTNSSKFWGSHFGL